jgi:glycosyltransferase involved in cell wall biosynthesis
MIHNCNHFKYLPDPVYVFTSGGLSETKNMLNTGAYKFLIFGWLDDRKNIINILKAYDGANFTFPTELLLVGPSREEFLSRVNAELQFLSSIDSFQKKVSIRAEFVSNEEMDNYFSICDVCLLIYKDFYGSSGLLGRAALHYKKVIGSNVGVVAELITENGLGVTCDPNSIEQITSALEAINDYNVEADACSAFYKQFAPDAFLSALVQV